MSSCGNLTRIRIAPWVALALLTLVACDKDGDFNPDDLYSGDALYGEDCDDKTPCASGLVCAGNGTCHYEGEPGTSESGDECVSSEYCLYGLVCNHEGVCAGGGDGTGGKGESCGGDEDCQFALQCIDGACHGFQVPLWFGGDCQDPNEEEGAFRVYFEVPGEQAVTEFYRLPFPNDGRVMDDVLDMTGHPTPGVMVPELGDVVGGVIDTLEQDFEGFGNNQAIFMRFSDTPDWDTIQLGNPGEGSVFVIDITEGSPEYGMRHSGGFRADSERGNYLCDNWIAFHNSDGRPYVPGRTYAAVITTLVRDKNTGEKVLQDQDFGEMLTTSTPSDARLHNTWQAYAPLRQWLVGQGMDPSGIAGAAVFTVGDPGARLRDLRAAVESENAPVLTDAHLCEDGDAGPFADAGDDTRGCDGVSAAFHEIQGNVALPVYQEGIPPYKDPEHGGGLNVGGAGQVTPIDHGDVVFSLTLPRNADMPETGWPLVLYAHGTGGNYRSFVANGVAELLSALTTEDGDETAFAILSIDGVVHGPRAAPENWDDGWLEVDPTAYDPGVLFFNVLNPRAARDNSAQAAADYFQLARIVGETVWDGDTSPTGDEVLFDADNLFYMGHSQGATTGVGFVAYEPALKSVVLSGVGGLLIESLSTKEKPYNLKNAIAVGIADPNLDRWHPMLNLVQALAESADPVNHARYVVREPHEGGVAKDLFHAYGVGDTYSPETTQYALARGFRIDQITNGHDPLESITGENLPLSGNYFIGDGLVTGAVVLHAPEGDADGHFVIFDVDDAKTQYTEFLATAVTESVPTIPSP